MFVIGWFISVTDKPILNPPFEDTIDKHFIALVLFSRVLYNVARGLGINPPATTHIIFSLDFEVSTLDVGLIDLDSDSVTTTHQVSSSTSLPDRDEEINFNLKTEAMKQRVEALLNVIPGFNVKAFVQHIYGIGHCAEFPNSLRHALSFM